MEMIKKVEEILSNLLKEKELELVDLSYKREGPAMVLRLVLDKRGGITLDECAWVNAQLGELLDKDEVIPDKYLLEVSSPGLDRAIKTPKDFNWAKDRMVRIYTYGPLEGNREHAGKVISCTEEAVSVILKASGATRNIPLSIISKARLEVEF